MLKRVQHDKKKCVIPNLFRGRGDFSRPKGPASRDPTQYLFPDFKLNFTNFKSEIYNVQFAMLLFHPLLESQGANEDCDPP